MVLVRELYNSKNLIWNLAKNDFKTKYAGSYLGITWAFVQPVTTILVFWVVFEYGLKLGAPDPSVPFILWLSAGFIPWFFFSEALNNATNSMLEYSYLVKKVLFRVSILPIVKIISSVFVHIAFVSITILIFLIYKEYPKIYFIQIFYYFFCTFYLTLSLSYITSAIVVFFRDLTQVIGIILQIGMWMTPILWDYAIVPQQYMWILKLNPMFYITDGYRDSFINGVWFWDKYFQTAYFWLFTSAMLLIGSIIFKRLKPHFSDVI